MLPPREAVVSIHGSLNTMAVIDLFDWIDRKELKGVLTLERGATSRRFGVAYGCATHASSNSPAEYLGQILINGGLLTEEQARAFFARLQGTELALGKLLLREGAVNETHLRAALELKIRESIYEALSWTDGTFHYEPERASPKAELEIAVPLRDCMLEGQSRAKEWRMVRAQVPDDDARFYVVDKELVARSASGETDEARLISDVARGLSVRDIILAHHSLPFPVYRVLAELALAGIVKLDRRTNRRDVDTGKEEILTPEALLAAAQARAKGGDRVGGLELARKALDVAPGDEEIKKAYQALERSALAELTRTYLGKFRVPKLLRTPEELLKLELSAEERYFVGRIDGRWDLLSLMRVAPLREIEALLTIRELAERGLISLGE